MRSHNKVGGSFAILQVVAQWFCGSLSVAIPFTPWVRTPPRQGRSVDGSNTNQRATKARAFRSLPLWISVGCDSVPSEGSDTTNGKAVPSLPLGSPLAAIPFTPWVSTPQRQGRSIFAAWFPVGCDSVPSVSSDTTNGKAVPLMGATPIREQPRQGNNVDHQRNGNRLACWFPVTKPVDLSLYYKL